MKTDHFVMEACDQLQAKDFSTTIALRLSNPESVYKAVHAEQNISPETKYHPWGDTSLSHGYPGNIFYYLNVVLQTPRMIGIRQST